jgi:dinuclear metal center YbgI/SA1388 family protein
MNEVNLLELHSYLNQYLASSTIQDYCPNGLQIEGKKQIQKVITGVTACQALINQVILRKADVLLVHHGYFWKGEDACLVGMKYQRIKSLIQHDISLLAYHLPLDVHPEVGNNAQLAKLLDISIEKRLSAGGTSNILSVGSIQQALSGRSFADLINLQLKREPLYIEGKTSFIRQIALCTGGAQDYILDAIQAGADAFITGEVSERTVHMAREYGIHFYAAGHHATERYGVKALGEHLAQKFGIEHEFVDIENPV